MPLINVSALEYHQQQQAQELLKELATHDGILEQVRGFLSQYNSLSKEPIDTAKSTSRGLHLITLNDTNEVRISISKITPDEIAKNSYSVLRENLHNIYSNKAEKTQELEDGLNILEQLYYALFDTLTNPEKLAPILADTLIVSPGLFICWEITKKIWQFAELDKNKPMRLIHFKCQKVLSYFERVPKSRIAEIQYGTGISTEELKTLLRLLGFVHQSNCFWHPPLLRKGKRRKKKTG